MNEYLAVTASRSPDFVRQLKAGAVSLRPTARTTFLSNVTKDKGTGCWQWRGSATVYLGNSQAIGAHVLSFIIFRGAVNGGVCRACGNNECVNPKHLQSTGKFGALGRPRIGVARLNVTVDNIVQEELTRCELEQGAHRNDVARHVLCEWAHKQRQLNQSHGSPRQTLSA